MRGLYSGYTRPVATQADDLVRRADELAVKNEETARLLDERWDEVERRAEERAAHAEAGERQFRAAAQRAISAFALIIAVVVGVAFIERELVVGLASLVIGGLAIAGTASVLRVR
jgi:hypothetical protein